jgi:CDP-glucose 4,6-dehydratase
MRSSYWHQRSVLVTGATGLLGGWLVKELMRLGAQTVVLVRDHAPKSNLVREGLLDHLCVVRGDLGSVESLRRVMAEYGIQTVFHLAAQALVGVAKIDPVGTLEANVRGTWNLLEAARTSTKPQVVVASSDKAYGVSFQLPYVETHPMQGEFPYEVSKSCADLISRMYAVTYGLPVTVVRCGNLFGGGDLNFSRTVPGLIEATLAGRPLNIRSNGKLIRDFLYVEDAVDAYLTLAEHAAKNPSLIGEAFNFSLEVHLTVLELVEMVLQLMGRPDLKPVIQDIAREEIAEQYLDSSKARKLLGWSPRFGMEDGLKRTIAWYEDFFREESAGQPVGTASGL